MIKKNGEQRTVRAAYNASTVRVYQAYNSTIAESALSHGTFVEPPFKMSRMSWIKPSFLWMMYRSGWAEKDINQGRILAIDISIEGFLWCLKNACLSSNKYKTFETQEAFKLELERSSVRIQWDPERNYSLEPIQNIKTIQIGLSKEAIQLYVSDWIQNMEDITDYCHELYALLCEEKHEEVELRLPNEKLFILPEYIKTRIAATDPQPHRS